MLDQYRRIKREHQGEVLFFRLGDFYEMFSDDAIEVSALLNLTLTHRNGLPMCGIPYHAARSYIARLLKCGKKIAICEQLTEPARGRGVIERQVVEIITPGTTVDEDYLDKGSSNYLAALSSTAKFISFAYIDLSTGDFFATSFPFEGAVERLRLELERLQVNEMVVQESLLGEYPALAEAVADRPSLVLNRWADWLFDGSRSRDRLERQFGAAALKGFGLEDHSPEIISAGALLDYLDDTAKTFIPHVRLITLYGDTEYVGIDESSQRNLELIRNLRIRFCSSTMGRTQPRMVADRARDWAESSSAIRRAAADSSGIRALASFRISRKSFRSSSTTLSEAPLMSDSRAASLSVLNRSPVTIPCRRMNRGGTLES
ncbi:hypothetical protein FACS189473_3630 [Spirochaetia bacterium]|nr:hypothetical protein FACS189473_3630 [Spirochaetia bacterium]